MEDFRMTPQRMLLITALVCLPSMAPAAVNTDSHVFVSIHIPRGSTIASSSVQGINDRGEVVGFYHDGERNRGFVIGGTGFVRLIDFPGTFNTRPASINNAGQVVGEYGATSADVPGSGFWLRATMAAFNFPGSTGPARGINAAGQIVGSYSRPGGQSSGYLYDAAGFSPINFPNAFSTQCEGINNLGSIVGWYTLADGAHGFLLIGGAFTTINFQGGLSTIAHGINDAGEIVGSYHLSDGRRRSFLLSRGTYSTIDFPGALSTFVRGINDAGVIVGYYTDSSGSHGFVATPRSRRLRGTGP
jgi:uncharacterized membrane protein